MKRFDHIIHFERTIKKETLNSLVVEVFCSKTLVIFSAAGTSGQTRRVPA